MVHLSLYYNRFIRASHYRYQYSTRGSIEAIEGKWWTRKRLGDYLPIVNKEMLKPVIERQGWKWYNNKRTNKS